MAKGFRHVIWEPIEIRSNPDFAAHGSRSPRTRQASVWDQFCYGFSRFRQNDFLAFEDAFNESRKLSLRLRDIARHDAIISGLVWSGPLETASQLDALENRRKKPSSVSSEYWEQGLKHIGMLPDVAADLKALGTPGADALADSAEAFLESWQLTWERESVSAVHRAGA